MKSPAGQIEWRWYMTAAAVKQYMAIAGLTDDNGGPNWGRAERELGAHTDIAREVGTNNTSVIFRTARVKCGDRLQSIRLEFNVSHTPREEGGKPQLVRVQSKGANRGDQQKRKERWLANRQPPRD